MSQSLTLTTFFRARDEDRAFGPPDYVAGFEAEDNAPWGVTVPLEPDAVEPVVLRDARFAIAMDPDGTLSVAAEGLGDAAMDVVTRSVSAARPPLDELVREAVRPDVLAMEDDAETELRRLRTRLERAVALVDRALDTLGG